MGIFDFLRKRAAPQEVKAADYDLNGNRFYREYIVENGALPDARPLRVAAALRAGLKISEDVGRMPVEVKTVAGDRKTKDDSPIARLLGRRPNGWQTPMEFVEAVTLKAQFQGVGRALIVRNGFRVPVELLPCSEMTVRRDGETGIVLYSGHVEGFGWVEDATRRDFIEVGCPHWADVQRISPADELAEIFRLAAALQLRQMADADTRKLRGFLTFPEAIDPEIATAVHESLKFTLPNTPILDSGAGFKELQATASDMQLLQTRQHVIEEVARAFGIHPLMLGHDAAGQSLTRVADVADYHLNVTLAPWVERWEQAIAFALLRDDQVAEFDTSKLFKMSPTDRAERLAKALGAGGNKPWITEDEARAIEGMNPRGDDFWKGQHGGAADEA